MKETRLVMGMPIDIEIIIPESISEEVKTRKALNAVFSYFISVDEQFSTYKESSEISRFNGGEIALANISNDMQEVFALADKAKIDTNGYFDITRPDGKIDPSGIVKGWAIKNAAIRLRVAGFEHYFVNAGGDIASAGENALGENWSVGIENPFNRKEIVKILFPRGKGVATSGSYIRGNHIYNPHAPKEIVRDIVSMTVIGPEVFKADVYATAAFAMGRSGISFIESQSGFEGYMIAVDGVATMTSHFADFTQSL